VTYIAHDYPRPIGTDHLDDLSIAGCPASHDVGWVCTRIDGHAGNHQAGIGDPAKGAFAAEWDDDAEGARWRKDTR
jgi:hypothetical protein